MTMIDEHVVAWLQYVILVPIPGTLGLEYKDGPGTSLEPSLRPGFEDSVKLVVITRFK